MSTLGQFLQFVLTGITVGSIYALVATGFTIIYNCTQVVNFAQGEFVMLGAMIAAGLAGSGRVSLPAACLIAIFVTTLIGCLVGGALLRPLRSRSVVSLIIITVGASIFLRGIAMFLWGKDPLPAPAFSGTAPIPVGGATLQPQSLWVLGTTLMSVALLRLFYRRTLVGQAMRACASCPPGAKRIGINIHRMTVLSFALAAALGAMGGIVIAPITFAQYDMGTMLGLKGFCAAIVGGLGSFTGGIAAGVVLGVLEALGAGFLSSAYKDAIAFVILLLYLFARRQQAMIGDKT